MLMIHKIIRCFLNQLFTEFVAETKQKNRGRDPTEHQEDSESNVSI